MCDVRGHKSCVEGLIRQGWSYLQDDPDTLLFLDVANLDHHWQQLKEKFKKLGPANRPRTYEKKHQKEAFSLALVPTKEAVDHNQLASSLSVLKSANVDLEDSNKVTQHKVLCDSLQVKARKHFANSYNISTKLQGRAGVTQNKPVVLVQTIKSQSLAQRKSQNPPIRNAEKLSYFPHQSVEMAGRMSDKEGGAPTRAGFIPLGSAASASFKPLGGTMGGRPQPSSPIAVRPSNLHMMKSNFPSSSGNLSLEELADRRSTSSSPRLRGNSSGGGSSPKLRASPCGNDESPVVTKRRRMNTDTPSSVSSPRDSPTLNMSELGSDSFDDLGSHTFDDLSDSQLSSPGTESPALRTKKIFRGKYRKDELWAAIESDYQYLMDEEIIETCRVRHLTIYLAKNRYFP